jgi:hypothetical protein
VRLTSLAPIALMAALAACSESTAGPNPRADELTILGSVMSGNFQNLTVYLGNQARDQATVTVNGATIPSVGNGGFYGQLPAAVAPGGQLTLVVSDGDLEATGTAVVPSDPEITSVTGSVAGQLTVQWTAAANPDSFLVALQYKVGTAGHGQNFMATGSARQRSFTAASLPVGATNFTVSVHAYNAGSFVGDATADSRMNVRSSSLTQAVE